jgi:hypothetical protein
MPEATGRETRSSSTRRPTKRASANLSPTAILDIVERLGLVDVLIDRLKGRIDEVDVDALLDEAGAYLKRNPEVLVVCLGAVTLAAGALVFLKGREHSSGGNGTSRPRRATS